MISISHHLTLSSWDKLESNEAANYSNIVNYLDSTYENYINLILQKKHLIKQKIRKYYDQKLNYIQKQKELILLINNNYNNNSNIDNIDNISNIDDQNSVIKQETSINNNINIDNNNNINTNTNEVFRGIDVFQCKYCKKHLKQKKLQVNIF